MLAASTVDEQVELARAEVARREALRVAHSWPGGALDRAQLELDYTKVRSEITGTIARRAVEPGQMVGPDRPLMAVVDLGDTWVVANLKETQLKAIKAGQKVDIEVDTFDGVLHGHVDSIAAGTGSRFSLLPPDNASGNFIKVTQRVPVKIKLDDRGDRILRPGMAALCHDSRASRPRRCTSPIHRRQGRDHDRRDSRGGADGADRHLDRQRRALGHPQRLLARRSIRFWLGLDRSHDDGEHRRHPDDRRSVPEALGSAFRRYFSTSGARVHGRERAVRGLAWNLPSLGLSVFRILQ